MAQTQMSREEVAERAQRLYEQNLRAQVETPENIGKMIIIVDVETGDYAIDDTGILSARRLHARRPEARLFGIHIGYKVADSLGGVMERTASSCTERRRYAIL
ncbi:MAG TPA: hypothetical protein VFB21_00405 [Chthonomonadaceae bacterium]|nr:hypothetical protein [Chthonomonadaceae bacterium]